MLEKLNKISSLGLSWLMRTDGDRGYFIHITDGRGEWFSIFQGYNANPETLVDQALSASMMYLATPKAN